MAATGVRRGTGALNGPAHVDRLRWLLAFQARDLSDVAPADWEAVQTALRQLTVDVVETGQVFPAWWLIELEHGRLTFLDERASRSALLRRLRPLTRATMRRVHQRLREVLDILRPPDPSPATSRPRIPYPALPTHVQHIHLMGAGTQITRVYGAEWPDLLWHAIAALLEAFGPRIARCANPSCRRLFVRQRRQAYCSAQCSQRVRSKKWYDAHRDVARERRRRPSSR